MEQCSGTIIDLPSAIWAPVIDGVPFLVVNGAKATVIAGTPQADIRVYWLNGDNGLFACKGVGGVGVGRSAGGGVGGVPILPPVGSRCAWRGVAVSGSVCQFRVCSCLLGHCTRSVGNAPLLFGCTAT